MTFVFIPLFALAARSTSRIFEDYRPWLWTLVSIVPVSLALLLYTTGLMPFLKE
jgi:hypothetical protein